MDFSLAPKLAGRLPSVVIRAKHDFAAFHRPRAPANHEGQPLPALGPVFKIGVKPLSRRVSPGRAPGIERTVVQVRPLGTFSRGRHRLGDEVARRALKPRAHRAAGASPATWNLLDRYRQGDSRSARHMPQSKALEGATGASQAPPSASSCSCRAGKPCAKKTVGVKAAPRRLLHRQCSRPWLRPARGSNRCPAAASVRASTRGCSGTVRSSAAPTQAQTRWGNLRSQCRNARGPRASGTAMPGQRRRWSRTWAPPPETPRIRAGTTWP